MAYNSNKSSDTESKEILGLHRITKKRLLELCKKDKLYQTPSLNDVLYLHYQGFQSIECLEDYTELKCLWLECNAISEIQGLEKLTKLKCLFLQSNLIKKIENLGCCRELDTINLSQNQIRKIENLGIDVLPVLNSLNVSSNYLKDFEDLSELENCKNVSVLDLSNNRIDDILVVKIFAKMPELKVLILQGNPVVSKIPQYRKTLILECKNLTYLDSRPVFPKDRACAEAWKRGGYEEERKENELWNRRERNKMRDSVNATIRLRNTFRDSEQHLTLLGSSDSEDESSKSKRSRPIQEMDTGVDMKIWKEVAGDDSKSETASSSDINVSPSTSVLSTTASIRGQTSSTSKCDQFQEVDLVKPHPDTKACILAESENMGNILKFIDQIQKGENLGELDKQNIDNNNTPEYISDIDHNDNNEICQTTRDKLSEKFSSKNITTPESDLTNNSENNPGLKYENQLRLKIHLGEYDRNSPQILENNEIIHSDPGYISQAEGLSKNSTQCEQNLINPQKDICTDRNENQTARKIQTTGHDPSSNSEMIMDFKNHEKYIEPLGERDDVKETTLNLKNVEGPKLSFEREQKRSTYERESALVTNQMEKDFEEMSSNMDVFMAQLQKDMDERTQALSDFFTQLEAKNDISSGSNDSESEVYMEDLWDSNTRLKSDCNDTQSGEELTKTDSPNAKNEDIPDKSSTPNNIEFGISEADANFNEIREYIQAQKAKMQSFFRPIDECDTTVNCDNQSLKQLQQTVNESLLIGEENASEEVDTCVMKEEELTTRTNRVDNEYSEFQTKPKTWPISEEATSLEKKNAVCSSNDDFEYQPLNIALLTRASIQALNSFEKEAKKLKNLLYKLEIENEKILQAMNAGRKGEIEENLKANNETKEIVNMQEIANIQDTSDEKEDICEQALGDIIESLELNPVKPELYTLTDIDNTEDSQEEETLAEVELPLSNTIRGVIDSFSEAFQNKSKMKDIEILEDSQAGETLAEAELPLSNTVRGVIDSFSEAFQNKSKLKDIEYPEDSQTEETLAEADLPLSNTIRGVIDSFSEAFQNKSKMKDIEIPEDSQAGETLAEADLPLSNTIRVRDSIGEVFQNESITKIRPIPTQSGSLENLVAQNNFQMFDIDNRPPNQFGSLQNLGAQPTRRMSNNGTMLSLDNLTIDYDNEESLEVRQMIDRVRAQRDRYNNTVEIIDGKQMVIDNDTGKLKELNAPKPPSTDSDGDYDTAQSEEEGACGYTPLCSTAEQLLYQSYREHCQYSNAGKEDDSDNEEFYSMEPLLSPNHLQCARSYEELKYMITHNSRRRYLPKGCHFVEKMRGKTNPRAEVQQARTEVTAVAKSSTENEDELLNKMMIRETKGRKLTTNEEELPRMPCRQPDVPTKIFEYSCETPKASYYCPEECQDDADIDVTLQVMGNDNTEVFDNDVYNFIYDDIEEESSDLGERLQMEDLNKIECQKEKISPNNISENEKNEIENNTDFESITMKEEINLENGDRITKETLEKQILNNANDIVAAGEELEDFQVIFRRNNEIRLHERNARIAIPIINNILDSSLTSLNNEKILPSSNIYLESDDDSMEFTTNIQREWEKTVSENEIKSQRRNSSPLKVKRSKKSINLNKLLQEELLKKLDLGNTKNMVPQEKVKTPICQKENIQGENSPALAIGEELESEKFSTNDTSDSEKPDMVYKTLKNCQKQNIQEENSPTLAISEELESENFLTDDSPDSKKADMSYKNSTDDDKIKLNDTNTQILTSRAADDQGENSPVVKLAAETQQFTSTLQSLSILKLEKEKFIPEDELNSVKTGQTALDKQPVSDVSHSQGTKKEATENIFNKTETQYLDPKLCDGSSEYNSQTKKSNPESDTFPPSPPEADILECNLEILDCNDDVIDTITVNAELHYEF